MTHALLSPSACHRWRACPASVVLTKDLPDESSDFAEEGTRAHRLAELKLLGTPQFSGTAVTARRRTDAETEEFKTLWADAPDEMQAAVCVYARTIADLIGEGKPSYFMVEHPVDVSSVTGEAFKAEPVIADAVPQVVEALSIPVPTEAEALSRALNVLDLIDQWTSAVRAEALRQLEIGNKIPGYKLVAGRAGIRHWADAKEAEAKLKSMKVPEALRYEKKLISPTAAAKLTKAKAGEAPVLTERQWAKLEALITRNESKGAVVPESDPRPALDMGEGFKVIEENK